MLTAEIFYQYLMQFHRLPMGDLGEIRLSQKSAILHVLDKQITPTTFNIVYSDVNTNTDAFIDWLAFRLSVSTESAGALFVNYTDYLKKTLDEGATIEWKKIGEWGKDNNGHIYFNAASVRQLTEKMLPAEKLIRNNPQHEVLVGDRTYSGEQLQELLDKNKTKPVKNEIRMAAVLSLAVAILCMLFSFIFIPGFNAAHQHQFKFVPKQSPKTYSIIKAD